MEVLRIDKTTQEVIVTLNSSELIELSNIFYEAQKEKDVKARFYALYADLIMCKDLCQYGHIDAFSFERMLECREKVKQLNRG